MVKQMEKKQKRSPFFAIYGLIIAVGLGVVAVVLAQGVLIPAVPALRQFKTNTTGTLAVAFGIWLVLLAIAFFLVVFLSGKDPELAKYKQPLPPRTVKKNKHKLYD